ncbi:MBL fold metallo-hydrolase [Novosphingobium capsulatum]|uniref:MBL fold metallo-hydrolase n=1 Tax=Novosphingobium capsulatum TaxID=13688 RepID=UPI000A06293D|nr:MBL fold metallo-hydrolase [Novosphingobium capsulatum]WQD91512.1 MBL fold metallo-hydrolase [Novosphingobium capsulatum]
MRAIIRHSGRHESECRYVLPMLQYIQNAELRRATTRLASARNRMMRKVILAKTLAVVVCAAMAGSAVASTKPATAAAASTAPAQAPDGLLLLGTAGGPLARADRAGIATLLTIGGRNYLVDAGEGVVHQLGKAGMQAPAAPIVFLTHLHDDHYAGLPGLASFSYTLRAPRLDVYGPAGTVDLVGGVAQVMVPNARIRMAEQGFKHTPAEFVVAHEYGAGTIFDDGNVSVSAVVNTHFDFPDGSPAAVNKSYSLRFDAKGHSIVFTGDTGPSQAVATLAKGADVLVSEMASHADRAAVPPFVRPHMDREHLSPLEVGKLAAAAGVKTLVLTHIGVTDPSDVAEIRSVFKGRIIVGADLTKVAL